MSEFDSEADDIMVACNNCPWRGKISEVQPIKDIAERIAAGETVPAGECPKCGCLASLVNCPWQGKASEVEPVKDIAERIAAGETVPAGECPKCGCLASLVNPDTHVSLVDQSDSTRKLPVTLKCCNGVIELRVEGYGTNAMEPGHSGPLYIELYEGKLRVLAWADINQEDPTHTIDLEGARETNRKEA